MNGKVRTASVNFTKLEPNKECVQSNVEITMGHDIGISKSYYKPTEGEMLEDYLKAVEFLSVNHDKTSES